MEKTSSSCWTCSVTSAPSSEYRRTIRYVRCGPWPMKHYSSCNLGSTALYVKTGRPSIAPEKLLRALLLQALYSVRSERMIMEQLDYNLLFR